MIFELRGADRDYFLVALATLFGEDLVTRKMKKRAALAIHVKRDEDDLDLFKEDLVYAISYKPGNNEKGSVQLRMTVDMKSCYISLCEHAGSLAKKNLIRTLEEKIRVNITNGTLGVTNETF